ncbi:MAG: bifunctional ornithine acetyltransferase/N-acetylglutamate synthase [Clostridia bacterium]|nr:bifunctional ornithine acetyltransferase/N-acetylglutamate synthase [Clostridia bacterium]
MITGGVTAAKGFTANGIHCGIRKSRVKRDLCLILSDRPASSAAVYTSNLVKGAPLTVTKKNLENGVARAVICNSGNANTCNADGIGIAEKMCSLTADALGIDPGDVIVASTGVIGEPLSVGPIAAGMNELVAGLGDHNDFAAEAIMTTDVKIKSFAVEFEIGGVPCRLGGIAKGSGMIHPNLATMLVFITTDCSVSASALKSALRTDVQNTFNMISIDGDTSTNDMVAVLANGASGSPEVTEDSEYFPEFMKALNSVTVALCRSIAADGEGATKLLECAVTGAPDEACAKTAAKAVVCSSLTKAAMFGADANWGRVLCAVGYSGAPVDPAKIGVTFSSRAGEVEVCRDGSGVPFSEEIAKAVLSEDEITIKVDLGDGDKSATAWGCDLTYDYVKINGDYRT